MLELNTSLESLLKRYTYQKVLVGNFRIETTSLYAECLKEEVVITAMNNKNNTVGLCYMMIAMTEKPIAKANITLLKNFLRKYEEESRTTPKDVTIGVIGGNYNHVLHSSQEGINTYCQSRNHEKVVEAFNAVKSKSEGYKKMITYADNANNVGLIKDVLVTTKVIYVAEYEEKLQSDNPLTRIMSSVPVD